MKLLSIICLVIGAVSTESVLLLPYDTCGGLGWTGAYDCQSGYSCRPVGNNAFPAYQCLPNTGPVIPHAFPWGQCGGQNFIGPSLCSPGWSCIVSNLYFSTCVQNENYTIPAVSPTPNLSGPGSYCGDTATVRGYPAECIPGFTCSGPGVYGYYVCLRSQISSTSSTAATMTVVTTRRTSTKSSTKSTSKSSTKSTTKSSTKTSVKASATK